MHEAARFVGCGPQPGRGRLAARRPPRL